MKVRVRVGDRVMVRVRIKIRVSVRRWQSVVSTVSTEWGIVSNDDRR